MRANRIQIIGVLLVNVGWSTCLTISLGGVGAVSIIGGLISEIGIFSFPIEHPLVFFGFLLQFGLPAAISIAVITLFIKVLFYFIGKSILWISLRNTVDSDLPEIEIPVNKSEIGKLIKIIEKKIEKRSKDLKKTGILLTKHEEKGFQSSYRFTKGNTLLYHFAISHRPDEGPNSIGFTDGWTEPKPNTYTALGTIRANIKYPQPQVHITNISLIENNGIPIRRGIFTYHELSEIIWKKICKIIGSRSN